MKLDKLGHTGITWPFTPDGARVAMTDVAAEGYCGIELFGFVIDAYPGGVAGVRADLDEAGLRLAGAYCSGSLIDRARRADDLAAMTRWAGNVAELGGDIVVVGAAPSERPNYLADDYRELCITLDEIGRVCIDGGVRACFHPHTGTPVETREQIARVMDNIDPALVSMAPDTGQIAKGGGDPVEVVRTYAELVWHIHLKDYVGGEPKFDADGELVDRTGYLDYVPLGDGVVDIPAIVATLGPRYQGWWMVELDGTSDAPRPPRAAAAMSRRYLDKATVDGR
jgi:inosose dehydratase